MIRRKCVQNKHTKNKGQASNTDEEYHRCLKQNDPQQLFLQNIKDVAYTIIDIMIICGISERKAKSAKSSIINAFKHYDEVCYRIDEMQRKLLRKEHLLFDLSCNCMMTRLESQLTYTIMKRAFRAFYYCTDEFGIPVPELEAQTSHRQECLWVHAAKRTAEIYAKYEGMFLKVQKKFEERIRCLYKELFERMQKRASLLEKIKCDCQNCSKTNDVMSQQNVSYDASHFSLTASSSSNKRCVTKKTKSVKKLLSPTINAKFKETPRKKCNCQKLDCAGSCMKEEQILSKECSQGPYRVHWIPMTIEPETIFAKPKFIETRIDCDDLSEMVLEEEEDVCDREAEICEGEVCGSEEIEIFKIPTFKCRIPEPNYKPIMLEDRDMCNRGDSIRVIEETPCEAQSSSEKSIDVVDKRASGDKKDHKPPKLPKKPSPPKLPNIKPPKTKINVNRVEPDVPAKTELQPPEPRKRIKKERKILEPDILRKTESDILKIEERQMVQEEPEIQEIRLSRQSNTPESEPPIKPDTPVIPDTPVVHKPPIKNDIPIKLEHIKKEIIPKIKIPKKPQTIKRVSSVVKEIPSVVNEEVPTKNITIQRKKVVVKKERKRKKICTTRRIPHPCTKAQSQPLAADTSACRKKKVYVHQYFDGSQEARLDVISSDFG